MRTLNLMLVDFYGHPARRGNAAQLASRALDCILSCETQLAIVDDVHFINLRRKDGLEVSNHFKWLANEFPVTFLFVAVGLQERGLMSEGLNAPASTNADEQRVAIAQNAWSVLHDWRRPPGLNDQGVIDGQHLRSWIRRARLQLADRDRADIGDHQIGQTLSGSPPGADGIWPAEEIRELIEDLASRNLESGLAIGVLNARGITTRGVYDGGAQEWTLAGRYREWGEAVIDRWPRTGRLLLELAHDYERQARREDAEAHARANDLY
jgi:hypothetical protein